VFTMSWLYHEKQDAGLCGVHALNNLLQGPYFSEVDLMQIAQRLDAQEKSIMAEQGIETDDFIKFAAEDSGNVALDGNFSVGVLREALTSFSIICTSITHPDMKRVADNPLCESAFLCNLQSHWFAIRKIGDNYWDLNSLHRQPNFLGELYLGVFLKQLQLEGYSIFVTVGEFPRVIREFNDPNWTIVKQQAQGHRTGGRSEEDEISKAIAASLGGGGGHQLSESEAFEAAIAASLKDARGTGELGDMDLAAALLLSMESPSAVDPPAKMEKKLPPEPEEGARDVSKICVRLPSGSRAERRFDVHNKLEDVFNWLDVQHNINLSPTGRFVLISTLPKREYKEGSKSLQELGLVGNSLLTIQDFTSK